MRKLFNDNWSFGKFVPGTDIDLIYRVLHNEAESQDSEAVMKEFAPVDLPHDWMIENTEALYQSSIGVYVKKFIPDTSKHNFVYFEGVYMNTTIYLNGKKVMFWPYGYSSFEADFTDFQQEGENELLVFVEYKEPNTRWYSGAGIYRDVWFDEKESERLVTDGIYFNAVKCTDGRFKVIIDTEAIKDKNSKIKEARITHYLSDAEGREIASSSSFLPLYREANVNSQFFYVNDPVLWDIENPYLYNLVTVLSCDDCTMDVKWQRVGFRTIEFDQDKGFFLNGRHVKIHGACQHHDLGSLGAAFNASALRRQFRELKKMGINSVRTSHNMPSCLFMDIADEMGMLIDSEAFDMWEQKKTENDYGNYFHDWCERDVESWVRRDRNHPSVIMWSTGNEIPDTNNEGADKIAIRLRNAVRRNDYRHNAYTTIGSNLVAWDKAQKCSDVFELSGYNYLESVYEEHHNIKFPHWCIYGSETASTVQSRGIYHFPKNNRVLTYEDMQCSCLDNCSTNWGAKSVHKVITDDRDAEYCFGQYIWTGWDYIGEPTPYFSKNSFFGHIDTAGFWKDTAYIFKAAWVDFEKEPFVHLSPYWDYNEGQLIDINVYSNAPKIALFFNGELVGEKELDQKKDLHFSGEWQLPYKKGELVAVAYDSDGNEAARDVRRSFTEPEKIILTPETETVKADGEDLMFIAISVVDKDGTEVANARNRMFVKVEGSGRLIGLDNGDSTDYEQYKTNNRKLFSGKLMAVIAPDTESGNVKVTVSSEGLDDAVYEFETVPAQKREGISCNYRVPESDFYSDKPIRKIEIACDGSRELDEKNKEVRVRALVYPEDTGYGDLVWKAVTLEGIASNSVKIEADGNEAVIKAVGDGEFRLICSSGNGKNHSEIMSELEFKASGLGSATLNPYEDGGIHGCQYSESNNPAELSFRGGVNFHTDGNIITFENIDFGDYGSDELAVYLYSYRNTEPIEIWDGKPMESELLYRGIYEVEPQYNVFQENVFKLSKRLKGVRGITLKFANGFVFGGFRMIYKEKAYGNLSIKEYYTITGDSYDENDEGIFAIGNNVDIAFNNMNFKNGVSAVEIIGRSNIASNPVHVRFSGENGDVKFVCDFENSDEIVTRTFPISEIWGENKVNFIFMPGSDFDFVGFRFVPEN